MKKHGKGKKESIVISIVDIVAMLLVAFAQHFCFRSANVHDRKKACA